MGRGGTLSQDSGEQVFWLWVANDTEDLELLNTEFTEIADLHSGKGGHGEGFAFRSIHISLGVKREGLKNLLRPCGNCMKK